MTNEELDRLADLIARALTERASPAGGRRAADWLPTPVRPEPPAPPGEPPAWSGAAQTLGDVAPGRDAGASTPVHRASTADLTRATRAAAAGKGAPRAHGTPERTARLGRPRAPHDSPIAVTIGVSNRHIHLSADHQRALFGDRPLTSARALTQPGQFAANETLAVVGPNGRIDAVRVVGPARGATQVELARSDAARIGVDAPLAASGSLAGSAGGVTLIGPNGRVDLARGVIIAARHLHLGPADARRWGLRDGDRLDVRCGVGARAVTWHDVLVRAGEGHATELHLDVDEANAAAVKTGDPAMILAWRPASTQKRVLITERDVSRIARAGERVPTGALLTPSARDRARALGLLDE